MFLSFSQIRGARLLASDGEIGHVKEVFFEDATWVIRYLVLEAGGWPAGREFLISPNLVIQPFDGGSTLRVALRRSQLHDADSMGMRKRVSPQKEHEQLGLVALLDRGHRDELLGAVQLPALMPKSAATDGALEEVAPATKILMGDGQLRSSAHMFNHDVLATDGSAGRVQGFLFCDESWGIRYLVVDTRFGWPGGRTVLLATQWITGMDWAKQSALITLTREQVQDSAWYIEPDPLIHEAQRRQTAFLQDPGGRG